MDERLLVDMENVLFEYRQALRRNPDEHLHLYADRFPEKHRDAVIERLEEVRREVLEESYVG